MVISDKYKYLFIELPLTGSTAVSNELVSMYNGERILRKHSRYHEFLKWASPEQKKYFVFSGIRNPMDAVVSEYLKIKNNHKQRYTTPTEWRRNGGTLSDESLRLYKEISETGMDFPAYFKKYFKFPYDSWASLAHKKFDYIIRFENISTDFSEVLKRLDIDPKRELPQINQTSKKENFAVYYTPGIRDRAVFIFGPFMQKWGYSFPPEWKVKKPSVLSFMLFELIGVARQVYWRKTGSRSGLATKMNELPVQPKT